MNQSGLFDPDPTGFLTKPPFAPGSDTSEAAAKHMDRTGKHRSIKHHVWMAIVSVCGRGLIDEEIAERVMRWTGCRSTSVVSARNALVKDGLVEKSGKQRKSSTSGLMVAVWRIK